MKQNEKGTVYRRPFPMLEPIAARLFLQRDVSRPRGLRFALKSPANWRTRAGLPPSGVGVSLPPAMGTHLPFLFHSPRKILKSRGGVKNKVHGGASIRSLSLS